MAANDPFASALDLAAAIRRREVSPVEALDRCLGEVDRLNATVNAVVWRDDAEAREAAQEAERVVGRTDLDLLPPFHGVPIPIKDLTPVEGWPVTYGSHAGPDGASALGEIVVDKLRDAGCVLACRTNTPEFGPITVAENLRYGITRNPWNPDRTPGGSSGGAGAAVAAGMFPVAHANDGGGSIRIPASCCGLVGLKPSRGRVPRLVQSWQGGVVEGVECWTVADSAAALDAMSGPDRLAWYNAPPPARQFADELGADQRPLRVGLVEKAPLGLPLDEACADGAGAAAALLSDLGHHVEPAIFDTLPEDMISMALPLVWAGFVDYDGVDWTRAARPGPCSSARARSGPTGAATSTSCSRRRCRSTPRRWARCSRPSTPSRTSPRCRSCRWSRSPSCSTSPDCPRSACRCTAPARACRSASSSWPGRRTRGRSSGSPPRSRRLRPGPTGARTSSAWPRPRSRYRF